VCKYTAIAAAAAATAGAGAEAGAGAALCFLEDVGLHARRYKHTCTHKNKNKIKKYTRVEMNIHTLRF
jgi:hypothetical protein